MCHPSQTPRLLVSCTIAIKVVSLSYSIVLLLLLFVCLYCIMYYVLYYTKYTEKLMNIGMQMSLNKEHAHADVKDNSSRKLITR